MLMAEKKLIIAVEGTAAMGPHWNSIITDYLEKIIRCFCGSETAAQKPSGANVELALVMFNSHGPLSAAFLVQRSGWTRDVSRFLHWLSSIPFGGGGFNNAAIAEGLAEALMMLSSSNGGGLSNQDLEVHKHCILVAASNPCPLPTPVYRPHIQNSEQSENEIQNDDRRLSDAETVAKAFAQCSVSLSVVSPRQVLKLKTIYAAAKRNPRGADLPIDNPKNPYHLVLISENFMEARAAFNQTVIPTLQSNQNPVKMDASSVLPVSGPPSIPSANVPVSNWQPITTGNLPSATVKIEPTTVTSMPGPPTFPHVPSAPRAASQPLPNLQTPSPISVSQENNETLQDTKPMVAQPVRPAGTAAAANVRILNDVAVAQARQAFSGGTSIGGGTPMLSNVISSGMSSSVSAAQSIISNAQSAVTSSGSYAMSASPVPAMSQPLSNNALPVSMGQTVAGMSQPNMAASQVMQIASSRSQQNTMMVSATGMSQQGQPGMQQQLVVNTNSAATMSLPQQQTSSQMQPSQSKYVKVWEGNLSGQRQGQPVFITKLEGYRSASSSETLAANWPETMQIVRLISQDHMSNKQYVGKADFLVFRAMNQHGFLGQLQEKKLCAVIQLPSQTLLLSVSDKACRLIGMLFPGDMVVFKPQIPSQQQQQQQMQAQQQHPQLQQLQAQQQQQQQLSHMQQPPPALMQQLQPQPPPPQQQQAYLQAAGRPQLMPQGQVSSQGLPNMPTTGFIN